MSQPTQPVRFLPARVVLLVAVSLVSLVAGLVVWHQGWLTPDTVRAHVAHGGAAGMVVFVSLVVLLEVLWLPRSWGLVMAGALYGPFVGGLLGFIADMVSAVLCYSFARYAGQAWVQGLVANSPRADRVVSMFHSGRGFVTVFVLRTVPFAHYTLVSYLAGLAGVSRGAYLAGNSVGILPGAVILPLIGDAALDPLTPRGLIVGSIGLVVAVIGLWLGRRLFKP